MILKSFFDLRPLIFKVTPHAVQRFRERVDPGMSDDQIADFLFEAWREARPLRRYIKGGGRYAGRGVVFGVDRRGGVTTVVTVHGKEEEFIWNRETFRRAAAKGVLRWR